MPARANILADMEKRILGIGDQLFGSEPREVSDGKSAPEPVPTIQRNLDNSQRWLGRLDEALRRIENRI